MEENLTMPAADIPTIYKFEDNIETAVVLILAALSPAITAKKQRSDDTRATPFSSVQFQTGEANPDHEYTCPDGKVRDVNYSGTLAISIVTDRNRNASSHVTLVSQVRAAFSHRDLFTSSNLPYYKLWNIRPTGTSFGITEDDKQDITTLTWDVGFEILTTAWPV